MDPIMNNSERKGFKAFLAGGVWAVGAIGGIILAFTQADLFVGICVVGLAALALPTVLRLFKKADEAR